MTKAIFGYGSLMLPLSVISRFEDDLPPKNELYEDQYNIDEESIVRDEVEEYWTTVYGSQLSVTPVKLTGFRRTYTWESIRGGAMLEAKYTGDEDDVLTGVLLTGLTEEQYQKVTDTEVGYTEHKITSDDLESYTGETPDFENEITIYTGSESHKSNLRTDRSRNATYHARIQKGFEYIERLHSKEVREQFELDFYRTTFEPAFCGLSCYESWDDATILSFFNTVTENERVLDGIQLVLLEK